MRTAILLGIYLNLSDFSSQAWSGPVSTEVEDHLGTLGAVRFLIAFFWHLPRRTPHTPPLRSDSSPPSQRAPMAHVPLRTAVLPAAPLHTNPPPAPA